MQIQTLPFDQPIPEIITFRAPLANPTDRFAIFHLSNPRVYKMILSIALDLKRRGHKKAGMKAIFERLRWLYALQTQGEAYKLNNNYTAHYARLIMESEPELAGFFEVRG